jgi:hypothetical protein
MCVGDRLDNRHLGWRLDSRDWFLIFVIFAVSVVMCRPSTPCFLGSQSEAGHRSMVLSNLVD